MNKLITFSFAALLAFQTVHASPGVVESAAEAVRADMATQTENNLKDIQTVKKALANAQIKRTGALVFIAIVGSSATITLGTSAILGYLNVWTNNIAGMGNAVSTKALLTVAGISLATMVVTSIGGVKYLQTTDAELTALQAKLDELEKQNVETLARLK